MLKQLIIFSSILVMTNTLAAPPAPASSGGYSDDSGSLHMAPASTGKPVAAPGGKATVQTGVVDNGDSLGYVVDPATQTKPGTTKTK